MMPLTIDEHERIAALHAFELLDTAPEPAFQELVQLAAQVCQAPIALISLVDRDRLWFQARVGIDAEQTSRDASFCTQAILGTDVLVVPDSGADSRFADHPWVTSPLSVRFYAGAPLVTPDGYTLGTLCLMDRVPRMLTHEQHSVLRLLAHQVIERIVLRQRVREAERSEERARLTLDTALAAIISFDARNRVIEWNQQAGAMFGWSREEALAKPLDNLILPPAERERLQHAIRSYGETGAGPRLNRPLQWTALHRDGYEIPIEIGIVPLKTRDGHIFNATIHDITQHKQQVAELAGTLAKSEQVSRHKSEFVARMSHEMRTPLSGVIGMTELLVMTELSPQQRELAETVLNASESLLTIINDILDISKIEAGKLDIIPAPFDLWKLVGETAEMLAVNAQKQNVPLIVDYAAGVPRYLIGDAVRIRQILVNLVGNAIKFTPGGRVLVQVECLHATLEAAQMRVSVQDTGIGISEEDLLRIFEDFAQAGVSNTRHYGGTGLGLGISRQLATLMKGTLEADSVLGEGSTFRLTLPLPIDPNMGMVPR